MKRKQKPTLHSYTSLPSRFGSIEILWQETPSGPKVHRIILPSRRKPADCIAKARFIAPRDLSSPMMKSLAKKVEHFLKGKAIDFPLDIIALGKCSPFQKRVLLGEYKIPRGYVSTYGRIAKKLGVPGATRAVGNALANNPFPIIIPCHRAIRSDGELGGYQGGVKMKRWLLEMEGAKFAKSGKVILDKVFY